MKVKCDRCDGKGFIPQYKTGCNDGRCFKCNGCGYVIEGGVKYYRYDVNIYYANTLAKICLMARNKKEALKFAKDFKGLVVGDKIKCGYVEYDAEYPVMEKQHELLKKALADGKIIIK